MNEEVDGWTVDDYDGQFSPIAHNTHRRQRARSAELRQDGDLEMEFETPEGETCYGFFPASVLVVLLRRGGYTVLPPKEKETVKT